MLSGSDIYNSWSGNSRRGLTSVIKPFVLKYNGPDVWEWGQYMAFRPFISSLRKK